MNKNRVVCLILCILMLCLSIWLCGCNKQVVDTTFYYSWAQIKMPDGTIIEGKLNSWNDYDGDQLQVKINGVTYLVHAANVILRS